MKKIQHIVFATIAMSFFFGDLYAETFGPLDDFKVNVADSLVKPFAADLGGLIGGADFSSGRTLGFPGLDIGAVGMVQNRPGRDNLILRNAKVKEFGLGMLQARELLILKTDCRLL